MGNAFNMRSLLRDGALCLEADMGRPWAGTMLYFQEKRATLELRTIFEGGLTLSCKLSRRWDQPNSQSDSNALGTRLSLIIPMFYR